MNTNVEGVVRDWFDQVWNHGRAESIPRIMAADAVAHGLPGGPAHGPAAFRPIFEAFRGAFPDLHIRIERTVTEGDTVAAYCHVTGTHTGDALGIAPSGKRVDFYGVSITRIADGMIREGWNCFDFLTMYQQIGAVRGLPGA